MTQSRRTNGVVTGARPDGRHDLWSVYESQFDAVQEEIAHRIAGDPELGVLRSLALGGDGRWPRLEHVKLAMVDGDWGPLSAGLRAQGVAYAEGGVAIAAWARVVAIGRIQLEPHLVAAYATEPDRLAACLSAGAGFVDHMMVVIAEQFLTTKESVIRQQSEALRMLSTPVLRVRERLLLLPIIGVIDTYRARQFTEALLNAIQSTRARAVVIDITGVPAVDTRVAQHLLQTVAAARLMGTVTIVTGLSPEVAQSLVALGMDLAELRTVGDLEGGLEVAARLTADGPAGSLRAQS